MNHQGADPPDPPNSRFWDRQAIVIARGIYRQVPSGLRYLYDGEQLEVEALLGLDRARRTFQPAIRYPFRRWCCYNVRHAVLERMRQEHPLPRTLQESQRQMALSGRRTEILAARRYPAILFCDLPEQSRCQSDFSCDEGIRVEDEALRGMELDFLLSQVFSLTEREGVNLESISLVLRYYLDGVPIPDLARELGCPRTTVDTRIRRTLQWIRVQVGLNPGQAPFE